MQEQSKFAKPCRIVDMKLVRKVKQLSCVVCDAPPPNDCDHIRTVGAGGGDELTNVWALCRLHHIEKHRYGIRKFVDVHQLPVTFEFGYPKLILK